MNWKLARSTALVAAAALGVAGIVLTMNLMRPLHERYGPALLHDVNLLQLGPALVFAGILLIALATARDKDQLHERLFVVAVLVVAAAVLMIVTGQWVYLIYVFIGGPLVVLMTVLIVFGVLRIAARSENSP